MTDGQEDQDVPDGAAVFPLVPPELGIHPLLLAALHAFVFLEGSNDEIVNPDSAVEAMEYMAAYCQRTKGEDLRRLHEDMLTLAAFAKSEKWPKQQVRFLQEFLKDIGVS